MIRYLRHKEIDKKRWDECIDGSVNRIIYAFSWYLDITAPGWDALVEDDYAAVFPLIHKRKFGIRYLYQPYYVQQLGLFSGGLLTGELVSRFVSAIPVKFRFAEIHLNTMNNPGTGGYQLTTRANYEIDLISPYETLSSKYAENTRRNLKKSASNELFLKKNIEPDELITLFRKNYGKKEEALKFEHYDTLRQLLDACLKKTYSRITGTVDGNGKLCAAAFFLEYRDRAIFLFAASDYLSRENGAMFFLIDQYIREHAGKNLTLDFEGSNDANLARFYKGFGASESSYPMITFNRLPSLIAKGVYFMKKFRR